MSKKNEVYPNSPLVEVVFEIQFSGEPAIECNRDKFYEKIRDDYPHIFVPQSIEGRPIALDPYRFEREDRSGLIMLSIRNLAVSYKKYGGYRVFKKETMRVFSIFSELFKLDKLNRIGLRYINMIPFIREKNIIPINNYLNLKFNLPKSIPSHFQNLSLVFESKTEGGSITTRIFPVVSQGKTQEALILDFDYAKHINLQFKSVEKYLEESHRNTKLLFEEFITDDYKKIMRGEVI
jgi:uncharacterized protein (TIGR04255 family)